MSHTAFEITTVASKCKNVQSLACWKNYLMVGCSDGTLHLYQTANANNSTEYNLMRTIPKFSRQKKAIVQLKVVEKWSMLLCLSDSYVCLHDLASFNFIKKMRTTKYCNTFCIHEDEGMLCCSVNKQLIIFKWDGHQFLDYNELDLPSNAKTISFLGPTRLCVGFRREYDLLDVETGDILRELVRTGKSEKPVLTTVKAPESWLPIYNQSNNNNNNNNNDINNNNNDRRSTYKKNNRYAAPGELLVSKDSWGIFFGQDGNASRNTSEFVQWTNCPISCMTAFPYLVSITPDAIEVHHIGTLRCAQLLTMNNANCLICSPATRTINNNNNNNSTAQSNVSVPLPRVFVSTSNSVHMLTMTPIDDQLNALAEKLCFPEAISLCKLSKERLIHVDYNGSESAFEKYTNRLYDLRWQFIRSLFQTSNYSRALIQCKEGISDPLLVISLFPGLAPDGVTLALQKNLKNSDDDDNNNNNNEQNIINEPGNNGKGNSNEYISSFDNKAITALLIPYLMYVRNKWKQILKKKKMVNNNRDNSSDNDDDNNHNLFSMNRIVHGSERIVSLKQLVDTCLLTAYIRTNASTSTIRNFYIDDSVLGCDCLVEETEALLLDMPEKWEELIWLYYSNDFHQKALDWLGEIQPAKTQPPYPSIKVRITKTVQYLHTLMGKISQSVMLPNNKQFAQHNNVHGLLVMEYFQWVFQQDPFFALKLFTSFTLPQQFQGASANKATPDSMKREMDRIVSFFSVIDPLNVLEHIKAQESSSTARNNNGGDDDDDGNPNSNEEFINSVCITFLEFALLDLPEKFAEYKDALKQEDEIYNRTNNDRNSNNNSNSNNNFYSKRSVANNNKAWSPLKALEKESLHEHLILLYLDNILRIRERKREKLKSPSKALGPSLSAEKEPGTSGDLRRRLLRFLRTSKFYRPEKVLSKFQKTSMYEERAILLRAAGRHEEALQIYVHDLGNLDLAAEYCEEVYQAAMKKTKASERSEGNDVYMKLMRTCLVPVMRRGNSIDNKNVRGWGTGAGNSGKNGNLIKRAVKLLRAHSSRIDIVEAIRLLPDTSEISELTPYFSSALKNIASQRRNNQIIKNMLKLEQLNAMKEQAILKSRSVVVDRDTRCQKCGHPFTARSVPAVFPDMSIYHVACSVESDEYEGY